jgi:stage II sporulation protein E
MNANEEIFATLDICIIDLYNGKIEFIKNGACPTYVKNKKRVQVVKSLSLPAGILNNINLTTYDKDIEDQDILVMCSDGIIESNSEYKNKEVWVKNLLEQMETTNAQKIADILLKEAIDNNYGKAKDDMTVIVTKIIKK